MASLYETWFFLSNSRWKAKLIYTKGIFLTLTYISPKWNLRLWIFMKNGTYFAFSMHIFHGILAKLGAGAMFNDLFRWVVLWSLNSTQGIYQSRSLTRELHACCWLTWKRHIQLRHNDEMIETWYIIHLIYMEQHPDEHIALHHYCGLYSGYWAGTFGKRLQDI